MPAGHIYILTNPSLKRNCVKIGFTRLSPDSRAKTLSRMAAIPTPFEVYYFCQVRDVKQAERRLHLVLDDVRICPGKEFFLISPDIARSLCRQIAAFEEEDCEINLSIYRRRDYCPFYSPRLSAWGKKVLLLMMGATVNNTFLEQISKDRRTLLDGFLSSQQIARHLRSSTESVSKTLSRFCKARGQLHFHYGIKSPGGPVFEFLRYHRSTLAWKFSDGLRTTFFRMPSWFDSFAGSSESAFATSDAPPRPREG